MGRRILGLDIGIGSLGWALLDMDEHEFVGLGVHLWDPPQESKTKVSLAAGRRAARSSRRNIKRTSDRKKHALGLLIRHGLVPEDSGKDWFQTVKGDLQPLEIRAQGLDRLLSDRELALALYNICSRRGYIPHGEGSGDDPEGKKVLGAISANQKTMAEGGWRTVGEMMLANGGSRNKGGGYSHCVTCEQLVQEVRTLFVAQRRLGNPRATELCFVKSLSTVSSS